MSNRQIFVQIAAYRDPELIHTLRDLFAKAKKPNKLRVCLVWQCDNTESIFEFENHPQVKVIKIPYQESKGACYARSLITPEYNNEEYTFQLDSHHRFIQDWDEECIAMCNSLKAKGYEKPLLTAYCSSYEPANDPAGRNNEPWFINYDRFQPEGPIFLRPSTLHNAKGPVFSRGVSGHFIFTTGQWCKDVPYDGLLYFHGEEITIAIRSYTQGYDLFHPDKCIVWHQYTRAGMKKHWDDHTSVFDSLNSQSYKRVRTLLGMDGEDPKSIDFGKYGLGNVRTLAQFERYAGVVFSQRQFHTDALKEVLAPVKYTTEEQFQSQLCKRFKHCIDIHKPQLPETDYDNWVIAFKDKDNKDIFRKDADEAERNTIVKSNPDDQFYHIWREFDTSQRPYKWWVWPHSVKNGWENKVIEGIIKYE